LLRPLVAPAEKNNKYRGSMDEVDAISGPVIDAHLANTLSNMLYVAQVPQGEATKTDVDPPSCAPIAKTV